MPPPTCQGKSLQHKERALLAEDEINRSTPAAGSPEIIPFHRLFHVKDHEGDKEGQRDDLLDDLQLRQGENRVSHAIGRDLQEVFKEGNPPVREHRDKPGFRLEVTQMCLPGEIHENFRER
jgi:hypothetical protein